MWLFFALLSAVFAGVVPILGEKAGRCVAPVSLALIRSLVVWIGAGILFLLERSSAIFSLKALAWLLGAGASEAAAWIFFYSGLRHCSASVCARTEKISVALTVLLSALLHGRWISVSEFLCILLVLLAVWDKRREFREKIPIFCSALCSSAQILLSEFAMQDGLSPSFLFAIRSLASAVTILGYRMCINRSRSVIVGHDPKNPLLTSVFLISSGVTALIAWMFSWKALAMTSAERVQAVTKMSFWVSTVYSCVRNRRIDFETIRSCVLLSIGTVILLL